MTAARGIDSSWPPWSRWRRCCSAPPGLGRASATPSARPSAPPARPRPIPTRSPARPTSPSTRPATTSTSPTPATTGSRSSTPAATSCSCSARESTRRPAATSAPSASGDTCQAGSPGSSSAAFETPRYLAVDNSGRPVHRRRLRRRHRQQPRPEVRLLRPHRLRAGARAARRTAPTPSNLPGFGPPFGLAVRAQRRPLRRRHPLRNCCGAINIWQYTQDGDLHRIRQHRVRRPGSRSIPPATYYYTARESDPIYEIAARHRHQSR